MERGDMREVKRGRKNGREGCNGGRVEIERKTGRKREREGGNGGGVEVERRRGRQGRKSRGGEEEREAMEEE